MRRAGGRRHDRLIMDVQDLQTDPELDAVVAEKAREHRVPGLSVGVLLPDSALASNHGVTSASDPLPVDSDTLFMIGSTTKTLTGTAVMSLVDQERLSLSDRLVDLVPGFAVADPTTTQAVTVGHLLNHTAGWRGDALPATGFGDDALALAIPVVAEEPQEFALGRFASYNNAALIVAGRVVECVTGQTFEQAVTELVLAPLGMSSTWFLPWEIANRRHAVGHLLRDHAEEPVPDWLISRAMAPAGGAASSLHDQLAFAAYHLDGRTTGTPPLKEETRLRMQEPTVSMRSTLTGVGVTWLLSEQSGVRLVSHGGNLSNLQTSAFHLAPDHGFALTVMGNSGGATAVGVELLAWCLEHYLGVPPRSPRPTLPLTPELLDQYAGTYDLGQWALAVTAEDGRLFVQMVLPEGSPEELRLLFVKPPTEMVLVGPDQLAPAAKPLEASADFVRDEGGAIRFLRHGMRLARRVEP
jgi:CubicO group peptidase (beta-lactamase class C family)